MGLRQPQSFDAEQALAEFRRHVLVQRGVVEREVGDLDWNLGKQANGSRCACGVGIRSRPRQSAHKVCPASRKIVVCLAEVASFFNRVAGANVSCFFCGSGDGENFDEARPWESSGRSETSFVEFLMFRGALDR